MKKNLLAFLCAASMLLPSCVRQDRYITITGYAQGGTYTVKLNLNGTDGRVDARPEEIRDSIDSILGSIDNSISGYNRRSLLSRFNSGDAVVPDGIFADLYEKAHDIFSDTEGVVDVASAPLFDIWGFGFANDSLPSAEKVVQVLSRCGMERLKRNMLELTDSLGYLHPDSILKYEGSPAELNYNAIAQGYSCDIVAGYLYSLGVKDMMVDIGEIFCDGCNPSGQPWTLGIDRPVDGNNEPGSQVQGIFRAPEGPHGIVTSGNYRKYYIRDGRKYAHTLDPRTGYPVTHNLLSATIVADDAMTADAYATYCMVVGFEEARSFLSSRDDMEGCLIYDEDGTFKVWCSDGFMLEDL